MFLVVGITPFTSLCVVFMRPFAVLLIAKTQRSASFPQLIPLSPLDAFETVLILGYYAPASRADISGDAHPTDAPSTASSSNVVPASSSSIPPQTSAAQSKREKNSEVGALASGSTGAVSAADRSTEYANNLSKSNAETKALEEDSDPENPFGAWEEVPEEETEGKECIRLESLQTDSNRIKAVKGLARVELDENEDDADSKLAELEAEYGIGGVSETTTGSHSTDASSAKEGGCLALDHTGKADAEDDTMPDLQFKFKRKKGRQQRTFRSKKNKLD